ncbi:hypothetical protein [Kitasatospora sp. NPDC059599]|uniref:hypothetical protein n=1 Tax=Kitasatospora sp. NPDC059599 TaxID=3346880 RepID=UPI0036A101F0
MNRTVGALCSAALLVAVAGCGVIGSGGPDRHTVVLPEPAPASARWIVNELSRKGTLAKGCPAPTLSTLAVLDTDGQNWALVFWLVDDIDVCWADVDHRDGVWGGSDFESIEDMTVDHPRPLGPPAGTPWYGVTAFQGRVADLRATGDTDHVLGPVHSRTVDLGGGKLVTFVSYGVRVPELGESLTVHLCPPTGDCRDVSVPG